MKKLTVDVLQEIRRWLALRAGVLRRAVSLSSAAPKRGDGCLDAIAREGQRIYLCANNGYETSTAKSNEDTALIAPSQTTGRLQRRLQSSPRFWQGGVTWPHAKATDHASCPQTFSYPQENQATQWALAFRIKRLAVMANPRLNRTCLRQAG